MCVLFTFPHVRSLPEPHSGIFWSFLESHLAQRPMQLPSSHNDSVGTGRGVHNAGLVLAGAGSYLKHFCEAPLSGGGNLKGCIEA